MERTTFIAGVVSTRIWSHIIEGEWKILMGLCESITFSLYFFPADFGSLRDFAECDTEQAKMIYFLEFYSLKVTNYDV